MLTTGIIILNYNSSDFLKLTLNSLVRAKNDTPWEVCVVENGSSLKDRNQAEEYFCDIIQNSSQKGVFIDAKENKGFSGGNNIGIQYFLEKKEITHICLLNSDVILTDYWLDILLQKPCDVVGPVTNAAGNEQTIGIDVIPSKDENAFPVVNQFARKRRLAYQDCCNQSKLITFFATVFTREVIETVGMLDEQFFPGSFEDDDYCKRVYNANFRIWIRRDCYIHHWGSGSFSNLAMNSRIRISQENKKKFEDKWGILWEDRRPLLLESFFQDVQFLVKYPPNELWAMDVLRKSEEEIKKIFGNMIQIESRYQNSEQIIAMQQGEINRLNAQLKEELPFKENVRQIFRKLFRRLSPSFWRTNPHRIERRNKKNLKILLKTIQHQITEAVWESKKKCICVFAPIFNEKNITDGYEQRVKAVDEEVLTNYYKIYFDIHDIGAAPQFNVVDKCHAELKLNLSDPLQAEFMKKLIKNYRKVYVHSVLQIMKDVVPDKARKILKKPFVKIVWDVHGSVPEEFALYGDYYGAQIAGEAEEFLAQYATLAITVNQAMKHHLEEKYKTQLRGQVQVMPIFNQDLLCKVNYAEDKRLKEAQVPLVVYAGGLQKWQKIGQMQDAIEEMGDDCRYKIFVPLPDEFEKQWGQRKKPHAMEVSCKPPAEVMEEYKECHYGFVLRDDIVVNNVACPTKLIEYLQFGIVPVLDTTKIGDFVTLGMHYVDYRDFVNHQLPTEEQRRNMAASNYQVLQKLVDTYLAGKSAVKDSLI
ncbi:glycosyltransferase [Anaerofilum sp. BX8]|uniref:Glycosyltransferase n=1 Tax=Anaerofilum hominis TaxID=2763016 RepID=A0A923IDX5_9FIRM|nr:glycosyltransferase [Anaerofilum hominis]MBC5581415.1 glycosyltransferase [Anaerofilum hominis]